MTGIEPATSTLARESSRDVIGQAKGVLMERERLSPQQAFQRLRKLSNHHNIKLRDLARDIVETGEVPDEF